MQLKGRLRGCLCSLVFALGTPIAAAQTASDFFDDTILHEVRLDIFPADWQKLKANFLDNTYYPCNFRWRYRGRYLEMENIGIRSRGTGSRSDVKPGLRVDFNRYEEGQTFLGLKSFVLRNNTQDASMLRERISFLFFRRMGIPASREAHARFYVNDQYIGLYTLVESIDKDFLKLHYGENDGYLYKYDYGIDDPPYRFEYRGADPALYSPKPFKPETNESKPDPAPLEAMIRTINQAGDAEFLAKMAEYLDLKQFMAYVAIENFLVEQDGMLGEFGMNNYYLYRFEKKNLSTIIPWDASNTFFDNPSFSIWHNITDVPADRQNVLMRRAMTFPELRNHFLETLARCAWLAGAQGGYLEQEVNREFNQVKTAAYEDGNKQCLGPQGNPRPCSNAEFDAGVDYLRQFARNRSSFVLPAVAQEITPVTQRTYAVPDRGGRTVETVGRGDSTVVGYGRIQPNAGSAAPAGLAIFGFRQNGVLVTEAGVPASPRVSDGRIYAEVGGAVNTGLAIANPNNQAATVSFYITDAAGRGVGSGSLTVPANGQLARFVNDAPFNAGDSLSGTLTFSSSLPIAVRALRGLFNERSEFLITTLPMAELTAPVGEMVILPHFAVGGGWTTQVVLVNPSDESISGMVQFMEQGSPGAAAQPAMVIVNGQMGSIFPYTVPGRSSRVLQAYSVYPGLQAGSVRILPSPNQKTPSVTEIFSFSNGGITVTEAGVAASKAGSSFRLYAEVYGDVLRGEVGAIQTGVAIANPSAGTASVNFELMTLEGKPMGLTGTATIPGDGQIAQFLNQIQGFEALQAPFRGVLRISTTSPSGIAVVGLRGRQNERGDFLITTTPPVDETSSTSSSEMLFPHLVDGGGYRTQLILYSGAAGQSPAGTLRFVSQSGLPLGLALW